MSKTSLSFKQGNFSNIADSSSIQAGDLCFGKFNDSYGVIMLKDGSNSIYFRPDPGCQYYALIGQGDGKAPDYQILTTQGGGTGLGSMTNNKLYYQDSEKSNTVLQESNIYITKDTLAIASSMVGVLAAQDCRFAVDGHSYFQGNITTKGKVIIDFDSPSDPDGYALQVNKDAYFQEDLSVGANTSLGGNVDIGGTLTVASGKATSLGGSLAVAANQSTSLGGNVDIKGNLTVSTEDCSTTLAGTLTVAKQASFNTNVNIEDTLTTNTLNTNGLATLKNLQVNETSNFTGIVTTDNAIYICIDDPGNARNKNVITAIDNTMVSFDWVDSFLDNSKLFVEGDSAFNGHVMIGSELHTFGVSEFYNAVTVNADTDLGGGLTVAGLSKFNNSVNVEDILTTHTLQVNSTSNFTGSSNFVDNVTMQKKLYIAITTLDDLKNAELETYLTAEGLITEMSTLVNDANFIVQEHSVFNGNVLIGGEKFHNFSVSEFHKNVTIRGVTQLKNNLTVDAGKITTLGGNLIVGGEANFNATVNIENSLYAYNITVLYTQPEEMNNFNRASNYLNFSDANNVNFINVKHSPEQQSNIDDSKIAFSLQHQIKEGNKNIQTLEVPLIINKNGIIPGSSLYEYYENGIKRFSDKEYNIGSEEDRWNEFYISSIYGNSGIYFYDEATENYLDYESGRFEIGNAQNRFTWYKYDENGNSFEDQVLIQQNYNLIPEISLISYDIENSAEESRAFFSTKEICFYNPNFEFSAREDEGMTIKFLPSETGFFLQPDCLSCEFTNSVFSFADNGDYAELYLNYRNDDESVYAQLSTADGLIISHKDSNNEDIGESTLSIYNFTISNDQGELTSSINAGEVSLSLSDAHNLIFSANHDNIIANRSFIAQDKIILKDGNDQCYGTELPKTGVAGQIFFRII